MTKQVILTAAVMFDINVFSQYQMCGPCLGTQRSQPLLVCLLASTLCAPGMTASLGLQMC